MTGWHYYLLDPGTGRVGAELAPTAGSFKIEGNKTSDCAHTFRKEDLRLQDRDDWAPKSGGLLMAYEDETGEQRPIEAGPITTYGAETPHTLELKWANIRWFLDHRVIEKTLSYKAMSLGTIARRLVQAAQDQKPNGGLPIVYGTPEEVRTGSVPHERNYLAWNLGNNGFGKRLTELSEVINGPDIRFTPEWVDETHTAIRWRMLTGTYQSPFIAQDYLRIFDGEAPEGTFRVEEVKTATSDMADRVWATGAGEGEGIVRTSVQDLRHVNRGRPFTEAVVSDNDETRVAKLRDLAGGTLRVADDVESQAVAGIHANDPTNPVGTYFVGDEALVTLSGYESINRGKETATRMRILMISGGLDGQISIDFKPDVWS